jgi:two-component system, cell cycle sensor histidine kinase and response regulator CckA
LYPKDRRFSAVYCGELQFEHSGSDKKKVKTAFPKESNQAKARMAQSGEKRVAASNHEQKNNNEDLYRILLEQCTDAIFLFYEKKFEYVNHRFEEMFGYTREEVSHRDFDIKNLLLPGDRVLAAKIMDGMSQGKLLRPLYEFPALTKDGRRIDVESSVSFVPYRAGKALQGVVRDITARKQAGIYLKDGGEKFRQFAELLPGSAFECDRNFMITFINKRTLQTFLYTEEDIAAGKCVLDVVAPEWLEFVLRQAATVFSGIDLHSVEIEAVRKDGSLLPIQISAAPIFDEGKIVGLRGLVFDITEHKMREAALRQSEERYRSIIETIEDGYYEVDLKGNLTNFNNAALKLTGWTREELKGASYKAFSTPEYYERLFLEYNKVYITGIPSHGSELAVMKEDGQKYIGELSVSLMRDENGKPTGFRGIVRDITERKKMEEELRESRETFKNVVANIPGIVFQRVMHKDGSTHLTYVSESINELGLDTQKLADPLKIFNFMNKEDKKRLLANIDEAMKSSGHLNWEGPTNINNIPRWHRCLASFRKLDNEDVIFDGLILDVTENKKAEEEKRELEIRLQQAQKMEAVGTLAGGIAHDFKNLLMGIQGYTSLMLLETDHRHSSYRKLKNIEEMVNSGANLTKQLLGFARRGRYEIKPVNFNDIISKTTALFGRTKKDVFIHRLLEKDLWIVEADQGQIEQMLLNLYVNAWQAMPGGGDLYLETKNVVIVEDQFKQYSVPAGNYIKISITDTGAGMDEATRERIFEPFFTTKEMGRGTGLGLATVYGIVKGHNGVIDVYSEKGHGTSFSIYLPATDKELIFEHKPMATLAKGCETILLVDDEDSVIEVTKELLKVLGYKIISVNSGADAIEIFRVKNSEIDLVILDMVMPELSGNKTFDALKAIDPQVKVILSSGYSISGEAAEIMKKGCRAFIQKPFNIGDISKKIRETLEKS